MRSWNPVREDGLQRDNPDVTFANNCEASLKHGVSGFWIRLASFHYGKQPAEIEIQL